MMEIGWAIHMTRCAHLDTDENERYAVNLVMPFSGDSLTGGPGPGMLGSDAVAAAGDLLKPWTWQETHWQLFASVTEGGAWAPLGAPVAFETGVGDGGAFPSDDMFTELAGKGAECTTPFSQADDVLDLKGENKRSLPHLLAPLTHWPAAISNGQLKLAGFIDIAKTTLDALAAPPGAAPRLACFPVFALKDKPDRYEPGQPGDKGGVVKAVYAGDPSLVIALQPLARQDTPIVRHAGPADWLPRAGARELAARMLAPLAVLSGIANRLVDPGDMNRTPLTRFATDGALRGAWRDALWAYFGTGWEAPYDLGGATYREHVLERIVPSIRPLLRSPSEWKPSASAFERTLHILTRPASRTWDTAQREPWATVAGCWKALAQGPATGKDDLARAGERFLRDWLQVADALRTVDTARWFALPWFLNVMSRGGGIDALPSAIDPRALSERAAGEQILQANAIGVLAECDGVAAWLANPVADKASTTLVDGLLRTSEASGAAPMALLLDGLTEPLGRLADAYLAALEAHANPATSRPHDGGVPIVFEAADPGPGFDETVRGYAIALGACVSRGAGKDWVVDTARCQWITDTAVLRQNPRAWLDTDAGSWWMHETVGSTLHDGIRSTSVEYRGKPVAAMRAHAASGLVLDPDPGNGDPDGSDTIDFRWRAEPGRETPLLGYGMAYKWAVACIDNAGGIVDQDYRSDAHCAVLRSADEALAKVAKPQWHYRSAVPPGAPVLASGPIEPAAFEFSEQTRAHAHLGWLVRRAANAAPDAPPALLPPAVNARIALVSHDQRANGVALYNKAAEAFRKYTLTFAAPAAPADFVERWLNTDIVLLEHGLDDLVSDAAFKAGARSLTEFRDAQLDAIRRAGHQAAYHPAVGALGVAVWFDGAEQPALIHRFDLIRTLSDGPGKPIRLGGERQLQLNVESGHALATSTASASSVGGKHQATVAIAPGSFARIRVFSLVSEDHFAPLADGVQADTRHRFYADMARLEGDAVPAFAGYRAFGPAEHWFEAAPHWSGSAAAFSVSLTPPGAPLAGSHQLAEDMMAFTCTCTGSPDWIRGMYVRRHDWHWTGYPVRLPRSDAGLEEWLASFSGVESYREGGEALLDTGFIPDPAKGDAWRYGSDAAGQVVLQRKALQSGTRPARYAAFTARPLLRMRSWLNPDFKDGPLTLERRVYADGALIPGRMPALHGGERLPAPPLRWAVPLTSTYLPTARPVAAGQRDIEPGANGNLLVFDDALRRTDGLSRLGGIGDTLEIDLVETRLEKYREIGVNPIFHANPKFDELQVLDLDAQEAFGLTHDINSNALVAQTGVVVTPRNAQGKWIMAKARARRVILPETLTNSALQKRKDQTGPGRFVLPLRVDGDTVVPLDFALDTAALPTNDGHWPDPDLTLHLTGGEAGTTELRPSFPDLAGANRGKPLRFLCSWHKHRWNGTTQSWRLQVLAQQRDSDTLAWRTIAKRSGFQNVELPAGAIERADLAVSDPYTARLVPMSDYTEPKWLTFIGSFGQGKLAHPEQYTLSGDLQSLRLGAAGKDVPLPDLAVHGAAETRLHILLVYRPLADITRGGAADGAGALLRVYRFDRATQDFRALPFSDKRTPDSLAGCHAHLCAVQCVTALSQDQDKALDAMTTFDDMVALMFPPRAEPATETAAGIAAECTLRLLPEFIGPIPLV